MKILYKKQQIKPKKKLLYSSPVELALDWKKGIDEGRHVSQASIAKEYGVSRARVTQILNILKFYVKSPECQGNNLPERKIRTALRDSE